MGIRKYPPTVIANPDWNNLIDFLGGITNDPLLSQNKLADKFTQTEHDDLANPHHPEVHSHTEVDPTVDASLKGITKEEVQDHPPQAHTQGASTITTETLDGDRLPAMSTTKKGGVPPTGAPSGKYLKDDATWGAPTGGGGGLVSHITFLAQTAIAIWTNMPAALTEFLGSTRQRSKDDLTSATQARIIVNVMVAGAATPAKIRAQYSTDLATWYYLDGVSGPSVDINTVGLKVSAWVNLAAGAKADVYLRIAGLDGDAKADPDFGGVQLQFK